MKFNFKNKNFFWAVFIFFAVLTAIVISPSASLAFGEITIETPKFTSLAPFLPQEAYTDYASFIKGLYNWGIGIVGFLAFIMMTYAGFLYMISGTIDKKNEAKSIITDALIGLFMALASFLVINIINPQALEIEIIQPEIILPGPQEQTVTQCLNYQELQNYIDNDYTCDSTEGGSCTTGEGFYTCTQSSQEGP